VDRLKIRSVLALVACLALLAGCGGGSSSSDEAKEKNPMVASVGSVRQANCTDWQAGSDDQRKTMVRYLRKFAGGPVGSSAGIQTGPVLADDRAYKLLESFCSKYFARGFKLYKLYDRAASFVGRSTGPKPLTEPGK
jgi:hypothetical protein